MWRLGRVCVEAREGVCVWRLGRVCVKVGRVCCEG